MQNITKDSHSGVYKGKRVVIGNVPVLGVNLDFKLCSHTKRLELGGTIVNKEEDPKGEFWPLPGRIKVRFNSTSEFDEIAQAALKEMLQPMIYIQSKTKGEAI